MYHVKKRIGFDRMNLEKWMEDRRIDNVKDTRVNIKRCGVCGSTMKIKTRLTGEKAGVDYWVCSRYPDCRKVELFEEKDKKYIPASLNNEYDSRSNDSDSKKHFVSFINFLGYVIGIFLFIFVISTALKVDLTKLIFKEIAPAEQQLQAEETVTKIKPVPEAIQPNQPELQQTPVKGAFYTYTDKNGTPVIVNDLERVPMQYRSKMKVTSWAPSKITTAPPITNTTEQQTPVEIINNRIHVPVVLTCQGRSVRANLLIDTGATDIFISQGLAQFIGARPTAIGKTTVADGRTLTSDIIECEKITVGSKSKENLKAHIIQRSSNDDSGLLGMSFLGEFPHTIDIRNKVIKWL